METITSDSALDFTKPSRRDFFKTLAGLSVLSVLPASILTACGEQLPPLSPEDTQQLQDLLGVTHEAFKIIDCDGFEDHGKVSLSAIIGDTTYSIQTVLEATEGRRVLAIYEPIGFNKFVLGIGHMKLDQAETGYTQRSFIQKALVEFDESDLFIFPASRESREELPKAFQVPLNGDFPSSFLVEISHVSNQELQIQRLSLNVDFTPTDPLGTWASGDYQSLRAKILERY